MSQYASVRKSEGRKESERAVEGEREREYDRFSRETKRVTEGERVREREK